MKPMTMAAMAALLLATPLPAVGQQQDHQIHHPQGAQAQAAPAQPQTPSQALPRQSGGPGMGMGMMGQGGGMGMGGPMMGSGMMGGGMMRGMAMMMGPERVEGRLAFLRAELNVTDAQQKAWNDFAAAMRSAAKSLQTAHAAMHSGAVDTAQPGQAPRPGAMGQGGMGMMGQGGMGSMSGGMMGMMAAGENPLTHLEHHEQIYAARIEAIRAVKGPLTALYNVLDDTQKQTLAQLRPLYMAMM